MELREWQRAALDEQANRAFRRANQLRLAVVALFVPLVVVFTAWGEPGWAPHLPSLLAWSLVVGALEVFRQRPVVQRLGALTFVLDVLFVFGLQWRSMPESRFPAGVAGFSLGLFVLLVLLAGTTLRSRVIAATTVVALPCQLALMSRAGVGAGAQAAAVVVLVAAAVAQHAFVRRLKSMVAQATASEVASRLEAERSARLETTNLTISRLLGETAEQANRLKALQSDKELLTSLLVHDLRAPLGAVKANLTFLGEEVAALNDADVTDAVGESLQVTERLSGMIGDLLNITRLEAGAFTLQPDEVLPAQILQRLGKQLAPQARARKLQVSVVADDTRFEADQGLLMRTLENLASNALRYTPSGGRVSLEARDDGRSLVLAVRNDGTPIPHAARAGLFDKFTQGDDPKANRRAGWGLGLYFCKLCAEAHGGSITVEDEPGWPTSFVIRLPRRAPMASAA